MKNLILIIGLALTTFLSFAQDSGITITVTVDNVANDNGKVSFALHTKDTFMKGQGLMNTETKIKKGYAEVVFKNVQPGEYAIIGLHDANGNDRMDFRENGMPLEAYGTSNNIISFGPPQYYDAKFNVTDKDLKMNIRF